MAHGEDDVSNAVESSDYRPEGRCCSSFCGEMGFEVIGPDYKFLGGKAYLEGAGVIEPPYEDLLFFQLPFEQKF